MSLEKQLTAVAKAMNVDFMLRSRKISYPEIFSETGLLPGLTKRADQLCQLCFGYGLGAKFEDEEQALLKSRVTFDQYTPDVLRIFCITDVLFELVKSSPTKGEVPLDELMYD